MSLLLPFGNMVVRLRGRQGIAAVVALLPHKGGGHEATVASCKTEAATHPHTLGHGRYRSNGSALACWRYLHVRWLHSLPALCDISSGRPPVALQTKLSL